MQRLAVQLPRECSFWNNQVTYNSKELRALPILADRTGHRAISGELL